MAGVADDNAFSQLVVIGSSAGGVEALSELVSTLPPDFPAPLVIAQHLEPDRISHLEEILSRRSYQKFHESLREQKSMHFEEYSPVSKRWYEVHLYPSEEGLSIYSQDITERKQAEAKVLTLKDELGAELSAMTRLHELSTQLFAPSELHSLLEEILDASINLQGADFGNIQLIDREKGELEIVAHRGFNQEFLEYFSDTDENAACGRAMKQGERVVIEDVENDAGFEPHREIAASAGYRAVQSTPLFDRKGELLGMLSTHFRQPHRPSERELRMTDLYARQAAEMIGAKLAEERLRENEEWLQLAARAAGSGTWEWDLANGEIRWSDEHHELFGLASEKPVTRERWFDVVHPDDLPSIEEAGRRCFEENEEWPEVIEYRIRRESETRWISAWGRTVKDDRSRPVRILGISVDVTDRKKAEEERERHLASELSTRAQAEERRRLSRELHDRVAHDMALVHQSLELQEALKERDPEKAAAKLQLARKTTREALESVRTLSMDLRAAEVSRGLEAALSDLLRDVIPPDASFEVSVEGGEAPVPAEARTQVFLILREAIRNAVAHSRCSRIKVRLQILPEEILGSVEDDGQGFHAHALHPAAHNGLKSMEERASLLGGTLGVSSTPGMGTTIQVTVPLGERDG
jgi:PAS domain S-box-containing protein